MRQMQLWRFLGISVVALAVGVFSVGCERERPEERDNGDETREELREAGEQIEESARDAGRSVGEALEEGGERLQEASEDEDG